MSLLFCYIVLRRFNSLNCVLIISPLFGSSPPIPDKCSYEIGRSFPDLLTVHSLGPSIESIRAKEVVFVFMFQSEFIFWQPLLSSLIIDKSCIYCCSTKFLNMSESPSKESDIPPSSHIGSSVEYRSGVVDSACDARQNSPGSIPSRA